MTKNDFEFLDRTLFPSNYSVTAAVYSRTGESVKLTLSGEENLVLPSDRYALMKLGEGGVLSREELLELKQVEARYMARKRALRLLERKAYTGAQLRHKLAEAMVPAEIVREVLEDLTERGYLDDEKYAEGWIAAQIKRKPQGRRLLYAGLMRKGVNRREAERLLTAGYPPELEEEQCEICMKKLAGQRGWDADELLPAVARRGFDSALIKNVYRRIRRSG